ncbi:MAG TPA: tetratricopeptide repeat protein [Verrucomicrobiae bacterium]|nr:tetratricopeptide repeat protein [Verrucomicrobiae bacterium]
MASATNENDPDNGLRRFTRGPALAILLFLLVACVFLPALKNDFIDYDDPAFVTENSIAQQGWTWAGVVWAFTGVVQANWHPITCLSHLTDCELFGLKPWGHHLTSVLLHALNAALLFVLLRQWTGSTGRSFFVAAAFGLHPLRVESVAWVAERKDVLSTFFLFLTLFAYRAHTQGKRWAYAAALFCFALGLMSKAMLVTLPCLLLLLDYWPLRRWQRDRAGALIREKIPFVLLTVAACIVTLRVQSGAGAVISGGRIGLGERLANAVLSCGKYLGKTFWPQDLALPYPYPKEWPMGTLIAAGVILLGVTIFVVTQCRRRPSSAVGWFWFLGTLAPVIGLVQVGGQAMADRYTYIPQIGLFILLAWLVEKPPAALRWAAAAALVICVLLTQRQLNYWQTTGTLFRHTLEVTENNAPAMTLVAASLDEEGKPREALALYEKALAINPAMDAARNKYGLLLQAEGRVDEAAAQFALAGNAQRAQNANANVVENNLGVMFASKGQLDEAEIHFRRALRLKPDDASAWANCGLLSLERGQTNEAIANYQKAVALDPHLSLAQEQLRKLQGH